MIYRHYKGGLYRFLFECTIESTLEPSVAYVSLHDGRIWIRPKKDFFGTVETNGLTLRRFDPTNIPE